MSSTPQGINLVSDVPRIGVELQAAVKGIVQRKRVRALKEARLENTESMVCAAFS
jgi:hypothetical protein